MIQLITGIGDRSKRGYMTLDLLQNSLKPPFLRGVGGINPFFCKKSIMALDDSIDYRNRRLSKRGYMRLWFWMIQLITRIGDRSKRGYMMKFALSYLSS
jgi:hypothetical protein